MELFDRLETKFRLDQRQKKALSRLGLFSARDLLYYFPVRYSDMSAIKNIGELLAGETATVFGKVSKLAVKKGYRSRIPMGEAELSDLSGKVKIVWFNQPYLAKMLKDGESVKLTGHVALGKYGLYLSNPEFEKIPYMPSDSHHSLFAKGDFGENGSSYPVYRETRGITSKWFYHAVLKIIQEGVLDRMPDYLPEEILKKYHLPSLKSSLFWIHSPRNAKDAEAARKRFAFEEVFFIQLERQHERLEYRKNKSFIVRKDEKGKEEFMARFPFTPTGAQKRAIDAILNDMGKDVPMSRLLEGDVGSGKTAVAATAAYMVVKQKMEKGMSAGLQAAYMAPTEILAAQHFESFIKYFNPNHSKYPINIGLITGSGCRKFPSKVSAGRGQSGSTNISRSQLLKWVESGEMPILIGTHALIQKSVKFKNLALAVIDEQHRFGTAQRRKLVRKDSTGRRTAPHLLSMTATPIPRTLALTIFGDLDLTLLDEMPAGRKQIITEIVPPNRRGETYEKIRRELSAGRQAYVICPRIFEPDPAKELALQAKSAVAEAKRLKNEEFPEYQIGILHSKMSRQKKEEVMREFSEGRTNILCATSVVEVGVNVPNATVIIIEGAERFGLAQLHQLRGRVLRSAYQAYCYIFAEAKSEKTMQRLRAVKSAKSGFELAEMDLSLRGAGELSGGKQWGVSDLAMEAIKNLKMVEAARAEAVRLINEDPELSNYPLLRERAKEKMKEFHFE